MRVLIVDDEPAVRTFLDSALRAEGYDTVLAADGVDALTKRGPFDLLLTDLIMPRMAGDALAATMRKIDPALKVLYLTAYSDDLFKRKIRLWTGEAFLDKPATPDAIVEAVELLVRGRPAATW
jgi:two-component system cell cycle sensor histidine kinase/response regulator CckA